MTAPVPNARPAPQGSSSGKRQLILVSCVSRKRNTPGPARELYTSPWFLKARRFVELTGCPWFILSAEYGLLAPDAAVAPYERTLNAMSATERHRWATRVLDRLLPSLGEVERVVVFAGERYREFLVPELASRCEVVVPLQSLRIGEQLAWFSEREREVS